MFAISGLSPGLVFKSPVYNENSLSRKPDLRSTVYWNPTYSTNANGKADIKFHVSDDASPISVEVMGMTSDGRPFSTKKVIEVKAPQIRP